MNYTTQTKHENAINRPFINSQKQKWKMLQNTKLQECPYRQKILYDITTISHTIKKITQISSKNPTIIRQTYSRTPRFTSSDSRKFFRFSKLRKLRGGEAFVVAKGHFPSSRSSPPATQITVGCGDVFRYWRGDGCCGIGYETLCRSIPILHNFFQSLTYSHQVTRNPNLSSLPSSAATTIPNISR